MNLDIEYPKPMINLSEQFFGKDKDLLEIEKCFEDLKKLENSEKDFARKASVFFRKDAAAIYDKIETILERKFNVDNVVLNISASLNAFTIPALSLIGDPVKYLSGETFTVVKTSSEYKFKERYPLMVINLGVPIIQIMTPAEITSIVLHEVGHNFYHVNLIQKLFYLLWIFPLTVIYLLVSIFRVDYNKNISSSKFVECLNVFINVIMLPIIGLVLNPIGTIFSAIQNNSDKFKGNIVTRYVYFFIQKVMNSLSYISSLPNLVTSMMQQAISFLTGDGMDNEKFSDNFASMYGYAADLSSGLQKLHNTVDGNILDENDTKYTKLIVQLSNEINDIFSAIFHIFDVHPGVKFRTVDQMEYINKEINSTDNPRLKAALEKERNRITKSFNDLKNSKDKFGGKYGSSLHYYIDVLKSNLSINNKNVRNMDQNNSSMERIGFKIKGTGYEE